jgi:hypothetical protein
MDREDELPPERRSTDIPRSNYGKSKAVAELISEHTPHAVRMKRMRLKEDEPASGPYNTGRWSPEECQALNHAVQCCTENGLDPATRTFWMTVSQMVRTRKEYPCRNRYERLLHRNVSSHRTWTTDEDILLVQLYMQHKSRWSRMKASFPGRTVEAIRSHATELTVQNEERKHIWTRADDDLLLELYKEHGNDWSKYDGLGVSKQVIELHVRQLLRQTRNE